MKTLDFRVIAILILSITSFRSAIADWNDVPTGSMLPTIVEGDRIVVNKLAYDLKVPFTLKRITAWSDPERFDVVIFFSPEDGKRLVKRVVGLPGDEIAMTDNRLFVNGEVADYIYNERGHLTESISEQLHPVQFRGTGSRTGFPSFVVPEGQFFVLGDNRNDSLDSRWFGPIERETIVGKAVGIAFSLGEGFVPRESRFWKEME